MAIHPARFSGRRDLRNTHQVKRSIKLPRSESKFAKALAFLLLVVLVSFLTRAAWAVLQPLENLPGQKTYTISTNYKERVNLLLAGIGSDGLNFLAVASIAADHKTVYLPLEPSLYINLARDKGFYRLSSAWKLGNLDGNEGMNLLRDSISRLIASPIDGYLATTEKFPAKLGTTPSEVKDKLSSITFLAQQIIWFEPPKELKSSFTGRELLSLLLAGRSQDLREVSLEGTLVDAEDGGMKVKTIDPAAFDSRVGSLFQEEEVVRAHPRVSIVNASGIPGAAASLSRYVKNLGGEVIILESAEHAKKSEIRDHMGGGRLSDRIAPLIGAEIKKDKTSSRADIEIIIGEDAKATF